MLTRLVHRDQEYNLSCINKLIKMFLSLSKGYYYCPRHLFVCPSVCSCWRLFVLCRQVFCEFNKPSLWFCADIFPKGGKCICSTKDFGSVTFGLYAATFYLGQLAMLRGPPFVNSILILWYGMCICIQSAYLSYIYVHKRSGYFWM